MFDIGFLLKTGVIPTSRLSLGTNFESSRINKRLWELKKYLLGPLQDSLSSEEEEI
jgi:hypothetical protein